MEQPERVDAFRRIIPQSVMQRRDATIKRIGTSARRGAAQHSTAQHSTARHGVAWHGTAFVRRAASGMLRTRCRLYYTSV